MFSEDLRYDYPLKDSDVVMDLGAHKLTFASRIRSKYGCSVLAFEPVTGFRSEWPEQHEGISYFPFGIGGKDESIEFKIKGDMTGAYADSNFTECVEVRSMKRVLNDLGLNNVRLIKINIEGGEFGLLEHMIESGIVGSFSDIQVQFHLVVENAIDRHEVIRESLLKTHRLTYDYQWCWENYARV